MRDKLFFFLASRSGHAWAAAQALSPALPLPAVAPRPLLSGPPGGGGGVILGLGQGSATQAPARPPNPNPPPQGGSCTLHPQSHTST